MLIGIHLVINYHSIAPSCVINDVIVRNDAGKRHSLIER